jgi:hypothetical protein
VANLNWHDIDSRKGPIDREIRRPISPHYRIGAVRVSWAVRKVEVQEKPLLRLLWYVSQQELAYARLPQRSWVQDRRSVSASENQLERGSLIAVEVRQNHTVMKTKFAIDQVKEFTPITLKEIVHGRAKALRLGASVKSEWSALSRLKISPEEKERQVASNARRDLKF